MYTQTSAPKSPSSVSVNSTLWDASGKQQDVCAVHGASPTPHLDSQMQEGSPKAALQEIISALNDLADESKCTKCTVDSVASVVADYVRDVRAAKKNGKWSKEEKKALKAEMKGLFKGIKAGVKGH